MKQLTILLMIMTLTGSSLHAGIEASIAQECERQGRMLGTALRISMEAQSNRIQSCVMTGTAQELAQILAGIANWHVFITFFPNAHRYVTGPMLADDKLAVMLAYYEFLWPYLIGIVTKNGLSRIQQFLCLNIGPAPRVRALRVAAWKGSIPVLQYLLSENAQELIREDIDYADGSKNAFDLAAKWGHVTCVSLLKPHYEQALGVPMAVAVQDGSTLLGATSGS